MRTLALALLTPVLAVAAAGCAFGAGNAPSTHAAAVPTRLTTSSSRGGGPVCSGGTRIPLKVLRGPGGATLLLVPVSIDGKGPFAFALDTGAARSAVDSKLAGRLGLKVVARAGKVQGVSGSEQASVVHVGALRLGPLPLKASRITSISLFASKRGGPVGLLGSDILSHFAAVCIDYQAKVLRLGRRV